MNILDLRGSALPMTIDGVQPSEAELSAIERDSALSVAELALVDAESAWFGCPSPATADGVARALLGVAVAWRVIAGDRLAAGDGEGFAPWGWSA